MHPLSWLVVPFLAATAVAMLLVDGGRYPPMTIALFVIGIAGIAYSLRAIAKSTESRDGRDTDRPPSGPRSPMHVVDEIQEFKAILAEALPLNEASEWLVSPHPVSRWSHTG
jgi:hypothetical protein